MSKIVFENKTELEKYVEEAIRTKNRIAQRESRKRRKEAKKQ